jgi:SAM-dependent methyltransferase
MHRMSADTHTHVSDQAWRQERDRLRALEVLFDPATTRHLARLGLRDGWRCLEVGAGAGSIARWLAMRVGPSGHVLATDLDPRFLEHHGHDNLEVHRHDITADPLPAGLFDLVHSRAVLEHIPDRDRALAQMVAAVRPGGWVVAEDLGFAEPTLAALLRSVDPPERAGLRGRLPRRIRALLGDAGHDDLAARLPRTLRAAGLEQVEAEVHAPLLHGGVERELLSAQPWVRHLPFVAVTAWGRRPAAGGAG